MPTLPQTPAKNPLHIAPPAMLNAEFIREHYLGGLAERTFARWVASDQFPRPDMRMGSKIRLWRRETVEAWVNAQCEETGADK